MNRSPIRRRAPLAALLVGGLLASSWPARASFINYMSREINVKVVYYGAPGAGLRENLHYIYSKTKPEAKGKLISLVTETERTEFFDFLPLSLGEIRGFKVRFHLYTTPQPWDFEASRRLILKGVDGVIFVADSDPAQAKATRRAWDQLHADLRSHGYDPATIPVVVQLDRRDRPGAMPVAELRKLLALPPEQAAFEAVSPTGAGVFDSLKAIAKQILLLLKKGAG